MGNYIDQSIGETSFVTELTQTELDARKKRTPYVPESIDPIFDIGHEMKTMLPTVKARVISSSVGLVEEPTNISLVADVYGNHFLRAGDSQLLVSEAYMENDDEFVVSEVDPCGADFIGNHRFQIESNQTAFSAWKKEFSGEIAQ